MLANYIGISRSVTVFMFMFDVVFVCKTSKALENNSVNCYQSDSD